MDVIVLQNEAFAQLQRNTFDYLHTLLQQERSKPAFGWLNNKEAAELLGVSPRTMQSWRDSGLLGFSQVGGKIYYSREDIDQVLRQHYKKPFAQA